MTSSRVAPKGERSIYVEHGVWYDPGTKHIHATLAEHHWSYGRTTKQYAAYRALLIKHDRWPAGAD